MSELHAAVGLESLVDLDAHLAIRRELAARYAAALADFPASRPSRSTRDASTYKDFTVIVDEDVFGLDRDAVAAGLKAEGADTRPYFYPPVHRQQAYADLDTPELPVTDRVAGQVISLPLWRDMPADAVDAVVAALVRLGAHADAVTAALGTRSAQGADACVSS